MTPFRWVRESLSRRPFLKNVSIMLGGAAGGQAISLALAPVLTRLYSPQEFGILSVYTAVLAIIAAAASLRYEMALPLVRSAEDAANLTAVCLGALLLTTMLLAAAVVGLAPWLSAGLWPRRLGATPISWYLGLLVAGYLFLGGYYIALYAATRSGSFTAIAKTRFAQGVAGPLSQIALAFSGLGAAGLLIGAILGQSAGTIGLFRAVVIDRATTLGALSVRGMLDLAGRYRRFPLIGTWASLIDAIGDGPLLYLLVSIHYSPRIAGFIFLAERIVARPLTIVGTSILQVFIGEAGQSVAIDPAKLKSRFVQVVARQSALAAVWIAVATLAGTLLMTRVFGTQWRDGVVYLQAMSLAFFAQAVIQPVFHTLQIVERQLTAALWQIGRLALTIALFGAGFDFDISAPWVITGYSGAQVISAACLLILMRRAIGAVSLSANS